MISPMTAPGTKVVCVDDEKDRGRFTPSGLIIVGDLDGLRRGFVYTVSSIQRDPRISGQYLVVLAEICRRVIAGNDYHLPGYSLARFKLAALPSCLTDTLTRTKIQESLEA